MASNENEEPSYDPEDFNIRAGISDNLSGSFKKPVMKDNTDNNGIENKGYTFSEIPLESSKPNTQVSFNKEKGESIIETNSQNGTGVQKMVNIEQEKRSIIKNLIVICIAFI